MAARSIRWRPGVLPIALGEATKLAGRMLDADKVYAFTIGFGAQTDTLDLEGAVIAESARAADTRRGRGGAARGSPAPIEQVPPAYSALKVDGERAYDLARAGETVVLKARSVTVYGLSILASKGRGTARSVVEGCSDPAATPLRQPCGLPPPLEGEDEAAPLDSITLSRTSPRAPISAASRATSRSRSARSATSPSPPHARPGRSRSRPAISLDNLDELG